MRRVSIDIPVSLARRLGRVHEIPRKVARPKPTLVRETAVVLWRNGKVFLAQRPSTGRWADLWEFPRTEVAAGQSPDVAGVALMKDLGFTIAEPTELTTIRHGVTRFSASRSFAWKPSTSRGNFALASIQRGAWLASAELSDHPVSRPAPAGDDDPGRGNLVCSDGERS